MRSNGSVGWVVGVGLKAIGRRQSIEAFKLLSTKGKQINKSQQPRAAWAVDVDCKVTKWADRTTNMSTNGRQPREMDMAGGAGGTHRQIWPKLTDWGAPERKTLKWPKTAKTKRAPSEMINTFWKPAGLTVNKTCLCYRIFICNLQRITTTNNKYNITYYTYRN